MKLHMSEDLGGGRCKWSGQLWLRTYAAALRNLLGDQRGALIRGPPS